MTPLYLLVLGSYTQSPPLHHRLRVSHRLANPAQHHLHKGLGVTREPKEGGKVESLTEVGASIKEGEEVGHVNQKLQDEKDGADVGLVGADVDSVGNDVGKYELLKTTVQLQEAQEVGSVTELLYECNLACLGQKVGEDEGELDPFDINDMSHRFSNLLTHSSNFITNIIHLVS